MRIEIFIVLAYLIIMVAIGLAFSRLNKSGDDFFKSGAKGSWWLVGMSVFMAGLSANTFTANGGVAYRAGWTVLLVYWAGALGAFCQIIYFAKRYRRTRKATLPEIIQERFGTGAQQVYSWIKVPSAVLHAGIWLWGMGIFTASAFDLDINLVIVVVGAVVTLMACSGGSWAVMASDFVQSLIIFSIVILLSSLVLIDFGGPSSFFHELSTHSATSDYSFFKPAGAFVDDKFTLGWAMAQMTITVIMLCSVEGSVRFLAVKDDRTAVKSACLVLVLMLLFPVIIFIPAWGSALALGNEVQAAGGVTPAESAYAVAARHWLPPQLLGLMGVAMLAATMSSMDTGINRSAGIVVRNIIPFIIDLRGKKTPGCP